MRKLATLLSRQAGRRTSDTQTRHSSKFLSLAVEVRFFLNNINTKRKQKKSGRQEHYTKAMELISKTIINDLSCTISLELIWTIFFSWNIYFFLRWNIKTTNLTKSNRIFRFQLWLNFFIFPQVGQKLSAVMTYLIKLVTYPSALRWEPFPSSPFTLNLINWLELFLVLDKLLSKWLLAHVVH